MSKDISNSELARMMQKQFSAIDDKFTTMEDKFLDHTKKIEEIIEPLKNSVDGLAKKFSNQDEENTANIGAHDRFNENFHKIKKHIKLDTIEAVKPL